MENIGPSSYNRMPFDKLYVKIKCTMCSSTKLYKNSGHHDPRNIYKWKGCPYCDHEGLQLIEAAQSTIIQYILQIDEEAYERIARAREESIDK